MMREVAALKVLALIPARGGSKGIPGKNIKPLAGKPLIAYTVEAARASGVVDRLLLSTDSEEIAALGRSLGIEVPFLRPPELAADDTAMIDVIRHLLAWLAETGDQPDAIVQLQPTAPLRRPEQIAEAVRLLEAEGCDSVVSVVPLPLHFCPDYVMRIEAGRLVSFLPEGERASRRQDVRPAYSRDGTVYAFRRETVERTGSIYGEDCRALVIDPALSINLDTPADWAAAERALSQE